MKINMYALKDIKAGAYMLPFGSQNDMTAIRMLSYSVNGSERSLVHDHPEDIELWRVGVFDDTLGVFESKVEFIRTAMSVKQVAEPQQEFKQEEELNE